MEVGQICTIRDPGLLITRLDITYEKFTSTYIPDPQLPLYKEQFVQGVAGNIRRQAGIDRWVGISHAVKISLAEWLALDEFWQEALFQSVDQLVREQNKAQQKVFDSINNKLDDAYVSPMSSMPKPTFHHH